MVEKQKRMIFDQSSQPQYQLEVKNEDPFYSKNNTSISKSLNLAVNPANKKQQKYIIRNNSGFRMSWDLFVIILAIWNSFTLPIEISFTSFMFFRSIGVKVFNYMIDFIFFFDILINFRTTYSSFLTGDEVKEPKAIAINYLRGRFWIDFISCIPFELVDIFNNDKLPLL